MERNEAVSSFRTVTHLSEAAIAMVAKELMVNDTVKGDLTRTSWHDINFESNDGP